MPFTTFFLIFNIHLYISPYKYKKLEGDHWRSFFLIYQYIWWHKCLLLLFYSFVIFISISIVRNKILWRYHKRFPTEGAQKISRTSP